MQQKMADLAPGAAPGELVKTYASSLIVVYLFAPLHKT